MGVSMFEVQHDGMAPGSQDTLHPAPLLHAQDYRPNLLQSSDLL